MRYFLIDMLDYRVGEVLTESPKNRVNPGKFKGN